MLVVYIVHPCLYTWSMPGCYGVHINKCVSNNMYIPIYTFACSGVELQEIGGGGSGVELQEIGGGGSGVEIGEGGSGGELQDIEGGGSGVELQEIGGGGGLWKALQWEVLWMLIVHGGELCCKKTPFNVHCSCYIEHGRYGLSCSEHLVSHWK